MFLPELVGTLPDLAKVGASPAARNGHAERIGETGAGHEENDRRMR
jgi:hypothetical protein